MTDLASRDQIRALPCFSGQIEIEPLTGGLSNENWLVSDGAGRHVVRLGRDFPFHHVDREREVMTACAAHDAGFAPRVEYSQPGIMVSAFVDAKTFDAADVRANPERIGRLIHEFHTTMPRHIKGPGFMFWVFHVIRDYARTLKSGHSRMADNLPAWLELSDSLEAAQSPLPIIFGHNDLLPANFLDDGHKLWLIDFEYAGFSTAMFDIAGAASNAEMNEDEAAVLLEAALGSPPDRALTQSFHAMQCASLLRETLWSLVSELHLDAPGVDYQAYTSENLARLDAALAQYHSTYGKTSP
ncbi:phosphotransferase family protein [Hoeflea sp. YIM 152468]|uniref:choline/ethanolamine kinase family protein n=1 Tax=Hoeflea sp. YIM 152468 TaxID=3031759 RepID=UPI0023D9E42D|nr:choline/ethanolamine kinase family protein [Hoeflea sp. YIM 152468]MDF1609250.1 phosphotransferase family protein [Hoeflea sp. YIM 152468]